MTLQGVIAIWMKIAYASENPTVRKVTRIADERRRGTEEERENMRNGIGTEKSDERRRGTQKKNAKEESTDTNQATKTSARCYSTQRELQYVEDLPSSLKRERVRI